MKFTAFNIIHLLITRSPTNRRVTSCGVKLLVRIEARLGTRFAGRRVHIRCATQCGGGGGGGGGGGVCCAWSRFRAEGSRVAWWGITTCWRRQRGGAAASKLAKEGGAPQWNKEKKRMTVSRLVHARLAGTPAFIRSLSSSSSSAWSLPRGARIDRVPPRKIANSLFRLFFYHEPAKWGYDHWSARTRGIFRGQTQNRGTARSFCDVTIVAYACNFQIGRDCLM